MHKLEEIFRFFTKSRCILLLEIGIYTTIFSILTTLKYYSFQTYAYDLGIYNQALHTTLSDGKLLYSTPDLMANPTGSLFGIHFSPILFAILPFYAFSPNPITLLITQSFAISLGAIPTYLIASQKLKSEKWGLLFATLYLLNPALHGINWYDFHPEAFLPVLLLFSFYFFDNNKPIEYIFSVVLALMCMEFAAILLVLMALYLLINMKPWKVYPINLRRLSLVLATLLLSIVWLFASLQVVHNFNPLVSPMTGDIYWEKIGATSLVDVPTQAILHPERLANALLFDGGAKLSFAFTLLGSVVFLPLFEPLIMICLIPWFSVAFVSNYPPFYQIGVQYPAFLIAFLFYGAILGMVRIKPLIVKKFSSDKLKLVAKVLLCILLVLSYISALPSTISPNDLPIFNQHDRNVINLLEFIPQNASVLTQNNIFPLLSNRVNAYLFPHTVLYPPGKTFSDAMSELLRKVDFIFIDYESSTIVPSLMSFFASQNHTFGLFAASDGAIILKRDYQELPVFFKPMEKVFNFDSFVLYDGEIVEDSDSKTGYALLHPQSGEAIRDFWYGPYVILPPGQYEAKFRLKISDEAEGDLIELFISCFLYKISIEYLGTKDKGHNLRFNIYTENEKKTLASRRLEHSDFGETNVYKEFALDFDVVELGAFEFRGTALSNRTDIMLDEVTMIQKAASLSLDVQVEALAPAI